MKRLAQIGACALALGAFALVSGTAAEAKCKKYSAEGITKELAKAGLEIVVGFEGAKAKGRTHYACKGPMKLECKATVFACK